MVFAVAFAPDGRQILSGGSIPPGEPGGVPDADTPELLLWRVPSDLELWAWRHFGGEHLHHRDTENTETR